MWLISVLLAILFEATLNEACRGVCQTCARSSRATLRNETKIVGGTAATLGETPWQVALTTGTGSNIYNLQFCGGTLINPDWVLTAAHCTEGKAANTMYVYAGFLDLTNPGNIFSQVDRKREHKSWDSATYSYDFALLRLDVGFDLPSLANVKSACLPSRGVPRNVNNAIISGWGSLSSGGSYPTTLQRADVTIWDNSVGQNAYGSSWTEASFPASVDGSIDSCQGDSGGPLVWLNGDRYEVFGVTSWGRGCAQSGFPGVYADVTQVQQWIIDTTKPTRGECP